MGVRGCAGFLEVAVYAVGFLVAWGVGLAVRGLVYGYGSGGRVSRRRGSSKTNKEGSE